METELCTIPGNFASFKSMGVVSAYSSGSVIAVMTSGTANVAANSLPSHRNSHR